MTTDKFALSMCRLRTTSCSSVSGRSQSVDH